jgi:hypothetical protein
LKSYHVLRASELPNQAQQGSCGGGIRGKYFEPLFKSQTALPFDQMHYPDSFWPSKLVYWSNSTLKVACPPWENTDTTNDVTSFNPGADERCVTHPQGSKAKLGGLIARRPENQEDLAVVSA